MNDRYRIPYDSEADQASMEENHNRFLWELYCNNDDVSDDIDDDISDDYDDEDNDDDIDDEDDDLLDEILESIRHE
ncbi:MAG: hypothetical protein ACRCST_11590 [Turicibacter sp.]